MSANPVTMSPATEVGQVEQARSIATGARRLGRVAFIAAAIAAVFAATYAIAWWRASNLSNTFLADADRSYEQGNYLEALTGYEEFDSTTNKYITRGGYMKVSKIWSDRYSWPVPSGVQRAEARIQEILDERLTIAEAEGFIQANIGQRNPYMGVVYLRLGELYEQEGDARAAEEIYSTVEELFPNEPDLIARAQENMARLGAGQ